MTDDRPLSADRVPTLTEVVELDLPVQVLLHADDASGGAQPVQVTAAGLPAATPLDAEAVAETRNGLSPTTTGQAPHGMADDFELAGLEADDVVADSQAEPEPDVATVEVPETAPLPEIDVDTIVGQVLSELMPRIDMLLESRLREALAPALARAADGLIRDTRSHLAVTVRDLVQEAVDRALQRRSDL